ncbi:hypothetical protein BS47DRAFT_1399862 [Hydnum rufescens UP504]|uniref:HECT-type E3 ubiquitin transferase n=1 Tax=Hydnum rufescens UP504 TaxID=1448309 RepID=A0A9P6AHS6_9AGAM|nr:hypothetical protein BS47DRAFT_1399862 [Hydnum rufescens UP504]
MKPTKRTVLGKHSKLIRKCLAWVISHRQLSDVCFVASSYKMIQEKRITLLDLKNTITDLFHGVPWILKSNTSNSIFEGFTITEDQHGRMVHIEPRPGGTDIPDTTENKEEYIETVIEYRTLCSLVRVFDEHEFKLLISDMLVVSIDNPSKGMSESSEPISISDQFTTRTEKCRHLVVPMRGIKNRSRKTSLNVVHLRVQLTLRPCGWVMSIIETLDQLQRINRPNDDRGYPYPSKNGWRQIEIYKASLSTGLRTRSYR